MSALPVHDHEPALRPIRVTPLPDLSPEARPASPAWSTRHPRTGRTQPRQGTLALVRDPAPTVTHVPPRRPRKVDDFGPVPTPTAELPDARAWAARLTPALMQVAAGARPAPQLMRHVDVRVYESLVRRHSRALRARTAAVRAVRIRTVRACHPLDGVAEVSLVLDEGPLVRALALRLEGLDGRWIVTAFEVG